MIQSDTGFIDFLETEQERRHSRHPESIDKVFSSPIAHFIIDCPITLLEWSLLNCPSFSAL